MALFWNVVNLRQWRILGVLGMTYRKEENLLVELKGNKTFNSMHFQSKLQLKSRNVNEVVF